MPSDAPASYQSKRPGIVRQPSSLSSHVSQSPSDQNGIHPRQPHHKPARHVVGHPRMGPRNPSFGRNLSKLTLSTATVNGAHDEGPNSAKNHSAGTPLSSPRHKPAMKRTQTSLALPKTSSHTALKKNHSSGQLNRIGSSKQVAKQAKAELSRSHGHTTKHKHKSSPPTETKQPSVRFDVGDDEDGEDMEGVDDGWTEDSASQSPNTTRDNTRSNTRQNSVVLDPDRTLYKQPEEKPPDPDITEEEVSSDQTDKVEQRDFAGQETLSRPNSYKASQQSRPPDADTIARKLLQRNNLDNPPPQVTDVSALASAGPYDTKDSNSHQNGAPSSQGMGSAPLVSRFINDSSAPGSKDGTPMDQSAFLLRRQYERTPSQRGQEGHESSDIKRNRSAPNFGIPQSPLTSPPASGAVTPSDYFRPSRTQQKLWLQRGLSNIEAHSQQHLPSLMSSGRMTRGGTQLRLFDKVEKEWAVVRRFRDPIADSLERLKRLKEGPPKSGFAANGEISPQKRNKAQQSPRISGGFAKAPTRPEVRSKVSFALSAPDDDDEHRGEWQHMSIDELEDATLDIRRQMWELHSTGEGD